MATQASKYAPWGHGNLLMTILDAKKGSLGRATLEGFWKWKGKMRKQLIESWDWVREQIFGREFGDGFCFLAVKCFFL